MDREQLLRLMAQIREAREAGFSPEQIDAQVAQVTGGQMKTAKAVAEALLPPRGARDIGRAIAQGATFGFADELVGLGAGIVPGGLSREEATMLSREAGERFAEERPGANIAAQIGGALIPAVATGGLLGVGSAGAGAGATALRAGAAGAIEGGLFGLGTAEGSLGERAGEAGVEAAVGGAIGAPLGAAAPVVGRQVRRALGRVDPEDVLVGERARGARIAARLEEMTGLEGKLGPTRKSVENEIERIRAQMFAPLERAHPSIDNRALDAFLRLPEMQAAIRSTRDKALIAGEKKPSFEQVQKMLRFIKNEIKAGAKQGDANRVSIHRELREEFETILNRLLPGFEDANRAFFLASERRRALDAGRKAITRLSAEEIEEALAQLPSDEARDAFRTGIVQRFVTQLRSREGPSSGAINTLVNAGPETRAKLRPLFPSEQTFNTFMRLLAKEGKTSRGRRILQSLLKPTVFGAGAGGVLGILD